MRGVQFDLVLDFNWHWNPIFFSSFFFLQLINPNSSFIMSRDDEYDYLFKGNNMLLTRSDDALEVPSSEFSSLNLF